MIAELLVCALLSSVLTISLMLSPPSFSKPLINTERPPGHMAQLDFLRVLFCLGVLAFHSKQMALNFTKQTYSSIHLANTLTWWGWCAVDVFFMVSGFLTTLKIVKLLFQGKPVEHIKLIIERFLRLWPLLILPASYGLLHHTKDLFTNEGTLSPAKWVGWLTFTGNFFTPMAGYGWYYDNTFVPCWSLLCDFQATILLIFYIPLHYKWFGLRVWPIAFPLAIAASIRAIIYFSDPPCYNRHMIDGITEAALPHTREFLQVAYGVGPVDGMAGGGCFKMKSHATAAYWTRLYFPVYARFASFFVGMGAALKYFSVKSGIMPLGAEFDKYGTTKMGRLFLSLSFCWIGCFVVSPYQPTSSPLYLAFEEIFWHIFCSIAFAILAFCVLVPVDHPFHVAWIAKFMGLKCFYVLGNASTWVYVMHWPILNQTLHWTKTTSFTRYCCLHALILAGITVPCAILCMRFVDPPFESLRKFFMNENKSAFPRGKETNGELQKLLGTVKPHDAQYFFANLNLDDAQKALAHLRSKLDASA